MAKYPQSVCSPTDSRQVDKINESMYDRSDRIKTFKDELHVSMSDQLQNTMML